MFPILYAILALAFPSSDIIEGIAIDPVTIYADSTFEAKSLGFYRTNDVFEILESSTDYREDEDQDLKFKWHKVKYRDEFAWVFGGSVAVIKTSDNYTISNIVDKEINLSGSYRQTQVKYFSLEGLTKESHKAHDDHQEDEKAEYEIYEENYLSFSNNENQYQIIDIGSVRPGGKVELTDIYFKDVASFGGKEIVLVKKHTSKDGSSAEYVQVLGMTSQEIFPIFEEKVSENVQLADFSNISVKKIYTIEKDFIHIEKPILFDCTINDVDMIGLEMESHAFRYSNKSHSFEPFYEPTTTFLEGQIIENNSLFIKDMNKDKESIINSGNIKIYGFKPSLEQLFAFVKTKQKGLGYLELSAIQTKDSNINLDDLIDVMYGKSSDLFSQQASILQFR